MNVNVKVCGLRHDENIRAMAQLPIQYMGFIFYPGSPRYVGADLNNEIVEAIPPHIQKVGVFVNEALENMLMKKSIYCLNYLQLHGEESPELCHSLKKYGVGVIKAFRLDQEFDFRILSEYEEVVDYFLFDTRSKAYGGSGRKFDWQLLEEYQGNTPFFLSGGIGPNDVEQIQLLKYPKLLGLDLNSGFEDQPGFKNFNSLNQFLFELGKSNKDSGAPFQKDQKTNYRTHHF